MDIKKIRSHRLWDKALQQHKQGFIENNTDLLDASFDRQIVISRELKVPLYDVMMAVRGEYLEVIA